LEQAFAIPVQRIAEGLQLEKRRIRSGPAGKAGQVCVEPLIDECQVAAGQDRQLLLFDLAVVLLVEHVVDGREADVLVAATVARDEVTVEKLVVVGGLGPGLGRDVPRDGVRVPLQNASDENRSGSSLMSSRKA